MFIQMECDMFFLNSHYFSSKNISCVLNTFFLQHLLAMKDQEILELNQKLAIRDIEILRDDRLKELHIALQLRDSEISNLRSQLDKFQSVFLKNPSSPKPGLNTSMVIRPRKQRAGISAEPQSETTLLELSKQTFPTIYKQER